MGILNKLVITLMHPEYFGDHVVMVSAGVSPVESYLLVYNSKKSEYDLIEDYKCHPQIFSGYDAAVHAVEIKKFIDGEETDSYILTESVKSKLNLLKKNYRLVRVSSFKYN